MPGPARCRCLHRHPRARPAHVGRGGSECGQSSLEYTGVLAVVAVVLALAATVTEAGGITNAVLRGFERALCVVGGGDCYATELQACALSSSETSGRVGLKLTLVKLGGTLSLLRQEMSDGTVDVTLVDGADAAPTAGLGASGGNKTGEGGTSVGAIATAELVVRLGRRRVWHVADSAAADRLIGDVKRHALRQVLTQAMPLAGRPVRALVHLAGVDGPELPPADEVGFTAGAKGSAGAELPGGAKTTASLDASLGGSRDRATRRTSIVLTLQGEASGALGAALGGGDLSESGGASATVTYDRAGSPLDLAVVIAGTPKPGLSGRLEMPATLKGHGSRSERIEHTMHLDLTHPDNRTAYDALLRALKRPASPGAGAALVLMTQRLAQGGREDLVRYAKRVSTYGAHGEVAAGGRLGVEAEVSRSTVQLRDAWTRPAGGVWAQRLDCVGGDRRA